MSEKQCVCPSGVTRAECISFRYANTNDCEWCECVCHDEDDDEQQRWYEEQATDLPIALPPRPTPGTGAGEQ